MQSTNHILLIRPTGFVFNTETADSNSFQNNIIQSKEKIEQLVLVEFENFVDTLKLKGVNVVVFDDTLFPNKPDAIFPNNWITFHSDGTIVLYPMLAENRRFERRRDIIDSLKKSFEIKEIIDLSGYEKENKFLEGTGSIVFDHINKIAYACLSPRTDKDLFISICETLKYRPIFFKAFSENKTAIYHTNVMMCITENFGIVCLESIIDKEERAKVSDSIKNSGKFIIDINHKQMNNFAGNMLSVKAKTTKDIMIMSQTAYDSLTLEQRDMIQVYNELVPISINTIETIGGGSVRCMMAEIFLQSINEKQNA